MPVITTDQIFNRKTDVARPTAVYAPALVCFLLSFVLLVIARFAPGDNSDLAVVFAPGQTLEHYFLSASASGAWVTGEGGLDNIILVRIPDNSPHSEIISRLYQAGALLVLNPAGAAGCLSSGRTDQSTKQNIFGRF